MSKQPNVELPIVTAEHGLGKSTAVKRKPADPRNKQTSAGAKSCLTCVQSMVSGKVLKVLQ